MDNRKIAFIICVNNMQYYEECVRYIQELEVPEGYTTDILCIQEADSMAQGYNGGMQMSNAKYKVYLHQDTFILNRNFIRDIVQIFHEDEQIGMLGVLGTDKNSVDVKEPSGWNIGNAVVYNGRAVTDIDFLQQKQGLVEVETVAGFIMVTQYDISWREDVSDGWHSYNVAQSFEMKKMGYKVVVPYQEEPWCFHDCGCTKGKGDEAKLEQIAKDLIQLLINHQYEELSEIAEKMREKWFIDTNIREVMNLMEIYSLENASISGIHSEWFALQDWNQILAYYNWVRFTVLRIEYEREDERAAELKNMVKTGRVSRDAIRKISAINLKDSRNVYPYLLREEREEPLVSVVIPVYNGENVLEAALDSVLNQTYRNIEVIVVDDASTDLSREKILAYNDSRIKAIFLEKNYHVCYSGNVGFENASGKYVALIGHDDFWREDKLEKQISFLEEHPSYGLCFTWANIVDEHVKIVNAENYNFYRTINCDNLGAKKWNRKLIVENNSFCAPSACIRSDVLKRTGYYRYALVQLQDYDLWIRMLRETEVYILQEKVTFYRKFTEKGKNLSAVSTETLARDSHERQWIHENFIKNLPAESFVRIFKEDMKNPNACGEKDVLCEKAFFLWTKGNCFAEKWFIELLENSECREIFEREYQFELTDFYQMNKKPMLFDETLVELVKRQQQVIMDYQKK